MYLIKLIYLKLHQHICLECNQLISGRKVIYQKDAVSYDLYVIRRKCPHCGAIGDKTGDNPKVVTFKEYGIIQYKKKLKRQ